MLWWSLLSIPFLLMSGKNGGTKTTPEPVLPLPNTLNGLRVTIVGGGPSGLLLAHRLLQSGASVNLLEKGARPGGVLGKRAYSLGLGIRGRTAIKSVDETLWQAVKHRGWESESFILVVGPMSIRLREGEDGKHGRGESAEEAALVEPSILLFQSNLCRALADELDARWSDSGRFTMSFDCGVADVCLKSKTVTSEKGRRTPFDLVVGCDGVFSTVRDKIATAWSEFEATQERLPGVFKVVLLDRMPVGLDPEAVQLLIPKAGSVTAFVQPTVHARCCVLFTGSDEDDILLSGATTESDVPAVVEALTLRYPKLAEGGTDVQSMAEQLVARGEPGHASKVTCNTYHYDSCAALAGDAAHATGGVSGQGVNSALVDSTTLADCLQQHYDPASKTESLHTALLAYSQRAVAEGKALYDLSFGPKPSSVFGRVRYSAKSARDSLFKGKWGIGELPLQTLLTTSLKSFADVRRDRDRYYEKSFPDQASWNATIAELDAKASGQQDLDAKASGQQDLDAKVSGQQQAETCLAMTS